MTTIQHTEIDLYHLYKVDYSPKIKAGLIFTEWYSYHIHLLQTMVLNILQNKQTNFRQLNGFQHITSSHYHQ